VGTLYAWEELGSAVWKASNTLCVLLMGLILHDTGVIWVEKQQLTTPETMQDKREKIVIQTKLQVIF